MAERTLWPIHLAGVTVMAVTLAGSTSAAVGLKVQGLFDAPKRSALSQNRDEVDNRDFHEASVRNMFGEPVYVGEDAFEEVAAPPPEEEEKEQEPISDEIVSSELPLGLVGTSVFSMAEFSLASIVDLNDRGAASEVYALKACGDPREPPCNELPGGAELRAIEVERVILFNPDEKRLEELRLDGEKKKAKKRTVKPAKYLPKPETKPPPEPKPHGYDIRKVGANSYEIPRSEVGKALGEMASLSRDARVVPVGEGFKLAWIRRGSVFEAIGVERGDIIKSANGYDVTSMEGAMQAFGKLKSASDISIDLLRGGSNVTLEYRVVD